MRKFLFALLVLCFAHVSASAQTRTPARRGTTTPARGATQAKPAATPAPARVVTPTPESPLSVAAPAAGAHPCACELPLPEVLAVVNGVRVTRNDLSEETRQKLQALYQQVADARKNELGLSVNTKLLEAEAKKRGLTTAKLFEQEVVAKVQRPTEAEALAFFNENKARIQQQAGGPVEFKDLRDRIVEYLLDQRQREETQRLAERLRVAAQPRMLVNEATPPATPADRARVFAVVNNQQITSGDVEDGLRPLVFSVQEQAYQLVRMDIELKINDTLLEQEAQKRKVTTKALLDTEVNAKIPTVTEAQAQTFYNENKARINGEFAQVKAELIKYLQSVEGRKTETAFAEQLRRAAAVEVFVKAPEPPVFQIATDDQPSKGNPAASVTVVEFTDYQCPACAQTHPVMERLMAEYGDRVRFVLRDYPLSQHEQAFKAAEAAEAAREQGKYWEYIALLFRNQSSLQISNLKEYATQLGLDRQKFDAALDSGRFAEKVQRDLSEGTRVGVNATPTIYVNGRRINDPSYEGIKAKIEAALRGGAK